MYRELSNLLGAARNWHICPASSRADAEEKLLEAVHALSHVDLTSDPDPDWPKQTRGDDADDVLALERDAATTEARLTELGALYKIATDQLEKVTAQHAWCPGGYLNQGGMGCK